MFLSVAERPILTVQQNQNKYNVRGIRSPNIKFNPQIFNEILNHESSYADDNERVYYENQSET